MRSRLPIERIGVTAALQLIRERGYQLLGRELVSPRKPNPHPTRYSFGEVGGCAEYRLTAKQVDKLKGLLP